MSSTPIQTEWEDPNPTVEARLAAWADLVSLLLLGIAILVAGGINPRRRIWGRSPLRNTLLISSLAINVIFSAGRLIAEGVLVETGPREFLLISVIYCTRWLWLFVGITRSGTRSAKAFKVAHALRKLKTIRLGESTKEGREREPELVIRKGARTVRGEPYWRGVQKSAELDERTGTWNVRITEKELHSNLLDQIGTVAFKDTIEAESSDALYKKFYDLVKTVDARNRNLTVNYEPFITAFRGVPAETRLAERVGATDETDVGSVARRVAADACYFIWHSKADFRTDQHVRVINECIEAAATTYFQGNPSV